MAVDLNDGRHLLIEVRARSYPCDSVIDQALPAVGDSRRGDTQNFAYLGTGSSCSDPCDRCAHNWRGRCTLFPIEVRHF